MGQLDKWLLRVENGVGDGVGWRDGETLVRELIGMGVREDKWVLRVENGVEGWGWEWVL